jgi:hypothetical protein
MSQNYSRPDAVEVIRLTLTTPVVGKPVDISGQVGGISIYEDVMFPVIRAEFFMFDALDLLGKFPIIGEEIIEIEFANPGYEASAYKFRIKSIENVLISPQGKSKTYTIRAVSEEMFVNNTKYVTKKYSTDSWQIITDIMRNEMKTQKSVVTGDFTKGIQDILISRLRPFQAIDMIRRRSVSQDYLSSSYVFFENKRGFNFASLEYLLKNQAGNIKDKVFYYDPAVNSSAKNMTARSILKLVNVSQFNNTKKMVYGSLNNIVKKFDLLTGETVETNYVNTEQQQKFKYASDNPYPLNSSQFEQEFGKEASASLLVPYSSHLPETHIAESIGAKHSFVTKLGQNIYHAHVNGDVALTAGDVITVNIPNAPGTGQTKENRMLSGNYLISKLRHSLVTSSTSQNTYQCSMELIKGNYEDNA